MTSLTRHTHITHTHGGNTPSHSVTPEIEWSCECTHSVRWVGLQVVQWQRKLHSLRERFSKTQHNELWLCTPPNIIDTVKTIELKSPNQRGTQSQDYYYIYRNIVFTVALLTHFMKWGEIVCILGAEWAQMLIEWETDFPKQRRNTFLNTRLEDRQWPHHS